MKYAFNLVGISTALSFFYQQQELLEKSLNDVEYLGHHQCKLDTFLSSVETVSKQKNWKLDEVVDSVIGFWINNSDSIRYWQSRLEDAGKDNLLVARVADIKSLRTTFESLLHES
ncbi:hypothetical protein [Lyngbya sp. PCC 8106]|uniref:hypothetical protein n=1 Tax=Lyngbya sp. (strain PCC 8106) TaxID=313612 RepID=UPI0000EA9F21|nr:hypothetical protein [Lyngbya sp. PCC 8106]EAW39094.1 hypothetical protein L8106_02227 [Lyngbya sp. PCC 8106]